MTSNFEKVLYYSCKNLLTTVKKTDYDIMTLNMT